MRNRTKVTFALLLASTFLLALAPSAIGSSTAYAGSSTSLTEIHGSWFLTYLNSTTLYTKGNWQYGSGYGSGFIYGKMHGTSQGEFLTAYNTKTQVILFSGQILCQCTLFGKHGTVWISMNNGKDVNASNPNGKTTATFVITNASGGLKGLYGSGPMKTTTSSDYMNFTMWVGFNN